MSGLVRSGGRAFDSTSLHLSEGVPVYTYHFPDGPKFTSAGVGLGVRMGGEYAEEF